MTDLPLCVVCGRPDPAGLVGLAGSSGPARCRDERCQAVTNYWSYMRYAYQNGAYTDDCAPAPAQLGRWHGR